ncbi:N-acetyltransferase [Flavobacteriaceae bacterium F89]|uniref:N-acetyltransferase n=1 Tax=Cerina litoralis TaxID=2874477 RepID=A0AAE3JPE5_9FLAO|nr:GNAT family N-acetyltransferase [Cerina litoralis]MCG2462030.1 N-acetyltransferase [Cerina litoralis]
MEDQYKLIDNAEAGQYEFHIDGQIAKIAYRKKDDKIYLIHTEVPKALGGRGIASSLAKKVLKDIEKNKLVLVPRCPFVLSYIKRHPEWKKLVMKGFVID